MKSLKSIASLVLTAMIGISSLATWPVAAQNTEVARPRSLVDHTRTDRLTGEPNPKQAPGYCPGGQVYSGGSCVLISNQPAYNKPWTAYFLGQRKCDDQSCFDIDSAGQVRTSRIGWNNHWANTTLRTPIGIAGLSWNSDGPGQCGSGAYRNYTIAPSLNTEQRLAGAAPNDWNISYTWVHWDQSGCGAL